MTGPLNNRLPRRWTLLLLASALPWLCGCASVWWNSFLDPSQVGNFHDNNAVNEIEQTISFRDPPSGIVGATDPTPEDLVQTVEEYQIGVGDQLNIRMLDFIQRDAESEFSPTVDELGYINLPQLGWIYVQGMTARELRSEIIQRARQQGIYREEGPEPTVVITFVAQLGRIYHIGGAVQQPGRYRIIPPDFRLREAINQAGGLSPEVKTIYVFRNAPKPKRVIDRGVRPTMPATAPSDQTPSPPVSPMSLSAMAGGPAAPLMPRAQPTVRPIASAESVQSAPAIALPTERDIMEAVSPTRSASAPASRPVGQDGVTPGGSTAPVSQPTAPFIFLNDRFIPAPAAPKETPGPETPQQAAPRSGQEGAPSSASKPVDWQELASQGQQRIIRIPAEKLMNGDPNYNIVIKTDDWIRLDSGHYGVFYIMGHVLRPGVFSITGQEITLRQAIAASGGLDALAWPTRCEITRRIDGDREETTQWNLERVMNGKDPDLFLKPEDLIDVGTHPIAPLLATIRNAFRLTYGFGFVYDRNFGDIDSFAPQNNPDDRRRAILQQRFPGLFF